MVNKLEKGRSRGGKARISKPKGKYRIIWGLGVEFEKEKKM